MIFIIFLVILLSSCLFKPVAHPPPSPAPPPIQFNHEMVKPPEPLPPLNTDQQSHSQTLKRLHGELEWVEQRLPKK